MGSSDQRQHGCVPLQCFTKAGAGLDLGPWLLFAGPCLRTLITTLLPLILTPHPHSLYFGFLMT